jgi:hypothetical protein
VHILRRAALTALLLLLLTVRQLLVWGVTKARGMMWCLLG